MPYILKQWHHRLRKHIVAAIDAIVNTFYTNKKPACQWMSSISCRNQQPVRIPYYASWYFFSVNCTGIRATHFAVITKRITIKILISLQMLQTSFEFKIRNLFQRTIFPWWKFVCPSHGLLERQFHANRSAVTTWKVTNIRTLISLDAKIYFIIKNVKIISVW